MVTARQLRSIESWGRLFGTPECPETKGLEEAIQIIPNFARNFGKTCCSWRNAALNQSLEHAGRGRLSRVGELRCDALQREESCGHFREEHQTPEGEAKRNDEVFIRKRLGISGENKIPKLHKETLAYEEVKMTQRSYK